MRTPITIEAALSQLALGVVEARGIQLAAGDERLREFVNRMVTQVLAEGTTKGDGRRTAVRELLRAGGYRPAGRNKPAQEYLLRTASETKTLPSILNAVDVLNAISLISGLPITLLALRTNAPLVVRYGAAGERFVFNRTGQELDLEGLITVSAVGETGIQPLGTPVKDSMLGKVVEQDSHILACIYAPKAHVDPHELMHWTRELAQGFTTYCGASSADSWLLPESW